MDTHQFLSAVSNYALQSAPATSANKPNKMGKVDPAYASGKPKITFDGESTLSVKAYPYLAIYTPVANDRVVLIPVGNTYVVLGKVIP